MLGSNEFSWLLVAKRSILSLTAAFALIVSSSSAQAQWSLIDDFEGLTAGTTVNGTTGAGTTWGGNATYTAEADPSGGSNTTLQVLGTEGGQHLRANFSNASNNILSGATGTLFYRFRTPDSTLGGTTDQVVGLSDDLGITGFGFKAGIRHDTDTTGVNEIDVRNGVSYEDIDLLQDSTWYSLWAVADNDATAGTVQLYLQSDTDATYASQTQLMTGSGGTFDFRNNSANPIVNMYFRGGNNTGGTADSNLFYDDIYINSSAIDLSNPTAVPEPTGVAILLSGMGMFLVRRRRR